MKLAWEMLELSKVIYGRQTGREAQLNRAQVHLKLGELGMEREDYAQATEDLSVCLSLQSSLLAPDDRLLAETQYQLGVSALLAQRHGVAVKHFCLARDIIKSRLDSLGETGDERERRDLRLLLPELAERIQDARDSATHQLLTTTTDSASAFSKTADDDTSSSSAAAPTSSSSAAAPTSSSAAAASSSEVIALLAQGNHQQQHHHQQQQHHHQQQHQQQHHQQQHHHQQQEQHQQQHHHHHHQQHHHQQQQQHQQQHHHHQQEHHQQQQELHHQQ
ncbi:unnamed protein product [Lampetra fluviatilis]